MPKKSPLTTKEINETEKSLILLGRSICVLVYKIKNNNAIIKL
jgi:hypothetical protein